MMAAVKLWLLVLVACSSDARFTSGLQFEGFPDLNFAIATRATQLTDVTGLVMHNEMFAVFPDLRFTCETGRIIRWWMIGGIESVGGGDVNVIATPTFSIQNPGSTMPEPAYHPSIEAAMLPDLMEISARTGNRFLYSFMDGTTEFKNGSFLKISHPSPNVFNFNLYYSPGNGPTGEYSNTAQDSEPGRTINDYPLIAVQTEPPACASGFLDVAYLESLVASVIPFHNQLRVIPDMNFSCAGRLTGLTVGASFIDTPEETTPAELQLWTCQPDAQDIANETGNGGRTIGEAPANMPRICERRTPILIIKDDVTVVQPNVYSISFEPGIPVEPGDFLGLFQPSRDFSQSIVYYAQQEGPRNVRLNPSEQSIPEPELLERVMDSTDRDLPLVAVRIDRPEDCANGFIDEDRLINRALLIDEVSPFNGGQQLVFPSVKFTIDGVVTKWTFAARINEPQGVWPELQIWREVPPSITGESMIHYERINSTMLLEPSRLLGFLNVYTYTPMDPLPFQAGDILGVFQPRESRLMLASIAGSGSMALTADTQLSLQEISNDANPSMQSLPLVTVEVRGQGTEEPPVVMPTDVLPTTVDTDAMTTPTDLPTTEGTPASQGGVPVVAIAGGAAGGVVLVLLIMVVLLVVVIVMMQRRRRRVAFADKKDEALENPVYTRPGYNSGGLTSGSIEAQNYEVPLQSFTVHNENAAVYQTVNEAQEYETPSITRKQDNNVYHVLEKQPNNEYHTLEGPLTAPYAEEYQVFVPTREERSAIPGNIKGRDIYASLKESQTSSLRSDVSYFVESEVYWKPASSANQIYQQLAKRKYREIPHHQIQVTDHLGSGQFGTVSKGIWQSGSGTTEVAVKMLKADATEIHKVKFLQEAAINGQFRHPNIVKLLGVVTLEEPCMIVLELLSNGDLRKYLIKQKPVPGEMPPPDWPLMFLGFCQHIAAGMDYLSKKGFVHRDLAARNILVAANTICKIADFGMSRDLEDESYYISQGGVIPVKWTAPEALNYKKYSTASDVWSFGVVMYEIWSLGHKPFKGHNSQKAIELVESGFRLPPPSGCPKEIYKLMIECWHPKASTRPSFTQLLMSLSGPEQDILSWSEEDIAVHPQAAVLGAPLEAGEHLYEELQYTYSTKS